MFLQLKPPCLDRSNALHRFSSHKTKRGPQHLMPLYNPIQRLPQRLLIQISPQSHPKGNVIGGAPSFHLRQKPQTLLRVGEWKHDITSRRCNS
jgi:hypothetical protein